MEQTAQGARPHCVPRLAVLTDLQAADRSLSIDTLLQFDSTRYCRPEQRADAHGPLRRRSRPWRHSAIQGWEWVDFCRMLPNRRRTTLSMQRRTGFGPVTAVRHGPRIVANRCAVGPEGVTGRVGLLPTAWPSSIQAIRGSPAPIRTSIAALYITGYTARVTLPHQLVLLLRCQTFAGGAFSHTVLMRCQRKPIGATNGTRG
jgi:hypothetical protein